MLENLLRRKPVDQATPDGEEHGGLKRSLGPVDLTALGIGAIIGAGIFSSTGSAAAGDAQHVGAGPALIVSYLLVAVACGFAALCYAELASMIPVAGSAYTYSYVALGELVAWIIGWDLMLEYGVGNVAVAISWGDYFKSFLAGFGVTIPEWMSTPSLIARDHAPPGLFEHAPHLFGIPIVFNLPAALIVVALTVILVVGVKESVWLNSVMVALKLVLVVGFIAVGAFYVMPTNWHPFAPNGFTGIMTGASVVFFAYIGFDAVSTTAEEARNPQRDMPIGMIASLMICTVLYVAVAAVLTGMVPFHDLAVGDPLAHALQVAGLTKLAGVLSLGAVIAMTAVLLVFQLGQPRIFMSMARDGLLPGVFARLHPRFRTPHINTIICGVLVAIPSMLFEIGDALDFTNIGTLFAFVLVSAGVIVLRRSDPNRQRPFRTPWVPLVPAASIVCCVGLMAFLPGITWLRFGGWLAIGFVIYFAYSRKHSRLAQSAPTPAAPPSTAH
ncbi:MAG: amino acid permease [Deltaproteobacteria bacterium]|nr:amino acid permease [Deltaproteobacteria bacterium]